MHNELIELLSYREGHFELESGHHGNLWIDLDELFLRPRSLSRFARTLADLVSIHEVDVVCGPLTGGTLVAQMVALELDLEFCFTERVARQPGNARLPVEYRLPPAFQGPIGGKRVAIIDDAVNAGSGVLGTRVALRECGAIPVVVGALIASGLSAEPDARVAGLPLVFIARLPSLLWKPDECPLCACSSPLETLVNGS